MNRPDLGPIRPEHITDEWRLDGDDRRWWLARTLPDGRHVRIYATTPTTTTWSVTDACGRVLREASELEVEAAKSAVKQWIEGESL